MTQPPAGTPVAFPAAATISLTEAKHCHFRHFLSRNRFATRRGQKVHAMYNAHALTPKWGMLPAGRSESASRRTLTKSARIEMSSAIDGQSETDAPAQA